VIVAYTVGQTRCLRIGKATAVKQYLITLIAGAAVVSAAILALHDVAPGLLGTFYNLMTVHPYITAIWGLLAIVGIDRDLVALRDGLSYSNVGAKAAAHLFGRKA